MVEIKRLQNEGADRIITSQIATTKEVSDWKMTLQSVVDKLVCRFVSLPPKRQTGLQLLNILGEEYKKVADSFSLPNHILEQHLAKIIDQLLKVLFQVLTNNKNVGFQEEDEIQGHLLINKEGKRQIHLYLLEDSLPMLRKVYHWYLMAHDTQSERSVDAIIVHFLLEEKKIIFSAPKE